MCVYLCVCVCVFVCVCLCGFQLVIKLLKYLCSSVKSRERRISPTVEALTKLLKKP